MRRCTRAAIGVLALVGLLLGGLLGGAAPSQARSAGLSVHAPHVFYVYAPGTGPGSDDQYLPLSVDGPARDVVLTLDLQGLGTAATLRDTIGQCHLSGTRLRCPIGSVTGPVGVDGLVVTAAPGSRPGQTGVVRYRLASSDAGALTGQVTVMVGRPALVGNSLRTVRGARPGATFREQVAFRNNGDVATRGLGVLITTGPDLDLLARHRNCRYERSGPAVVAGYCVFPDAVVRPSQAVAFGDPAGFVPRRTLMYGELTFSAWSLAGPSPDAVDPRDYAVRGDGAPLRLTSARPGTRFADSGGWARVTADNHADFAAYGATVRGRVGQTVQIEVGVRNRGPGSMDLSGRERSESYALTFTPPAGTTVVGNPFPGEEDPWTCAPRRKAAPAYHCTPYGETVNAGDRETFVFNLRIDKQVPGATGSVEVVPATSPWPARDPDATDDVATVTTHVTADTRSGDGTWPWVVGLSAAAALALLALVALVWRRRVAASSG